jgi:hypothetical protein
MRHPEGARAISGSRPGMVKLRATCLGIMVPIPRDHLLIWIIASRRSLLIKQYTRLSGIRISLRRRSGIPTLKIRKKRRPDCKTFQRLTGYLWEAQGPVKPAFQKSAWVSAFAAQIVLYFVEVVIMLPLLNRNTAGKKWSRLTSALCKPRLEILEDRSLMSIILLNDGPHSRCRSCSQTG